MEEQTSITLKLHDDILQKSSAITLNIGDKYKDSNGFVWKCDHIGYGHITFVQDINIEYSYWIPASQRGKPYYILTHDQAKMMLQCPYRNWTKTTEPTRTIKH